MNKKYMDFVPARSAKRPVAGHSKPVVKAVNSTHKTTKTVSSPKPERLNFGGMELGVVEDLTTGNTQVSPKVAHKPVESKTSSVKFAKAQKITAKITTKPSETPKKESKKEDEKTYKTPKSPFINQDKVQKRPLSKNVYRKKPVVAKEEKKAPVTIITKPEKDTKVGIIIAIILTIILGAAAGTVAFLLLPK